MNNILFLDREFYFWINKQSGSSKLYVIISPSFYIAKMSTIPFETISKAKQIETSIFEGFLPNGEFCFETHKLDNDLHLFLAIDYQAVLSKIQDMKLDYKNIIFYTSQSAFKAYEIPLFLQRDATLICKNGVFLLSRIASSVDVYEDTDFSLLEFINKINFKSNTRIGSRAKKIFMASLVAFGALFFADLAVKVFKIFNITAEISDIRTKSNIPHTNIELQSALKNLTATNEKQKNIRLFLNYLLSCDFFSDEYIKSIKIGQNIFEIEINTQRGNELKKIISQKLKIEASVVSSNSLYIKATM